MAGISLKVSATLFPLWLPEFSQKEKKYFLLKSRELCRIYIMNEVLYTVTRIP